MSYILECLQKQASILGNFKNKSRRPSSGSILGALKDRGPAPMRPTLMTPLNRALDKTHEGFQMADRKKRFDNIYSMLNKQAAPVFASQKTRNVPEHVVEIANAIRRDDPSMDDEAAYRIAWSRHKGQAPGHPKEPYSKSKGKAPDPHGVRTKLHNYVKAHGEAASHGLHEVGTREEKRLLKKSSDASAILDSLKNSAGPQAPLGDDTDDSDSVSVIHSHGGTAVVLTPDQISQIHEVLSGGAQGLMLILPKEGTGRPVHFNPIPAEILGDNAQLESILDSWEQDHAEGSEAPDDLNPGVQPSEEPPAGPPPPFQKKGPPDQTKTSAVAWNRMSGSSLPKQAPSMPWSEMLRKSPVIQKLKEHLTQQGLGKIKERLDQSKTSGFVASFLSDMQDAVPMEKTANSNQIHGTGRGIAAAIDSLIKGAGQYTLEEMMDAVANSTVVTNPEVAKKIGQRRA